MINENLELLRRVKYIPLCERPVELVESRLYQNQLTFEVSLSLLLKNISNKEISSVFVNLCGFDEDVNLLFAKVIEFNDLTVKSGEEFQKEAAISSLKTASVTVTVNRVCYADGGEWLSGQSFSVEEEDTSMDDTAEIPVIDLPSDEKVLFSEKERRINERRAQRMAEKELWKKEKKLTPEEIKKKKLKRKIMTAVTAVLAAVILISAFMGWRYASNRSEILSRAVTLYNEGRYQEAEPLFDSLTDLSGSKEAECRWYHALNCIKLEDYSEAMSELALMKGGGESAAYVRQLGSVLSGVISAGERHTVGLKKDGTVLAKGDDTYSQCDTESWTDIIAVSAGLNHTVGLKSDGSVVSIGDNKKEQCKTEDWDNIIGISAGESHTVGVMNNGRVVTAGDNEFGQCDLDNWSGIVAVSAGSNHTVGLRQDGTVVAAGDNSAGQCEVGAWENIVSVSAGNSFTVGVKSDGTVLAVGDSVYNQIAVEDLENILMAEAGDAHGLFVTYNGRLQTSGDNDWHQREVELWKDLISVSGGVHHSVGVSKDGTVFATGDNKSGQCNVTQWTDMGLPKDALKVTSIE